jgi:hypothetical protein
MAGSASCCFQRHWRSPRPWPLPAERPLLRHQHKADEKATAERLVDGSSPPARRRWHRSGGAADSPWPHAIERLSKSGGRRERASAKPERTPWPVDRDATFRQGDGSGHRVVCRPEAATAGRPAPDVRRPADPLHGLSVARERPKMRRLRLQNPARCELEAWVLSLLEAWVPNLLNVIKFSPDGGRNKIPCRADPRDGRRPWSIIPPSASRRTISGRVCGTFEQVDSSLSNRQHATGLDLPLVRAMMGLDGGTFER